MHTLSEDRAEKEKKRYRRHLSYCPQHKRGKSGDGTMQSIQNQNSKAGLAIFLKITEFFFG